MNSDWAIETSELRKVYGDVVAVDSVDLRISHGECFSLLGPNGAGKTTTTEILAGFRQRTSGDARVLGVDPGQRPRNWRAEIGIVLQTAQDLGELTVAEVVGHFSHYYPNPRPPGEVIEAVGLSAKSSARVANLSGGQRRRLDVGLGIVGRPKLLFLDEPTTGFDPEARQQFWTLIEALKAEGTTILLTTHYLDEAEALADRVAIIARGRVLACDHPAKLGRREQAPAVVSWLDHNGQSRQHTTHTPTAFVAELQQTHAGEIPGLQVIRPNLEQVYLQMIDDDATMASSTSQGERA